MYKYRNTVTGAVITTKSACSGKNWEPVKGKKKTAPEKETEAGEEAAEMQQDPEPKQSGTVIGPAPTGEAESNE